MGNHVQDVTFLLVTISDRLGLPTVERLDRAEPEPTLRSSQLGPRMNLSGITRATVQLQEMWEV